MTEYLPPAGNVRIRPGADLDRLLKQAKAALRPTPAERHAALPRSRDNRWQTAKLTPEDLADLMARLDRR